MSYTGTIEQSYIEKWLSEKLNLTAIEQELAVKGFDKDAISAYVREFKRRKNAKKIFPGFALMGTGALLGFVAMLLAVAYPSTTMYYVAMYGLTTLAVLMVFYGLYLLMG
ncbi:MAG: hypothetical protein U0X40_04415 [Ferruginibacter sp.]